MADFLGDPAKRKKRQDLAANQNQGITDARRAGTTAGNIVRDVATGISNIGKSGVAGAQAAGRAAVSIPDKIAETGNDLARGFQSGVQGRRLIPEQTAAGDATAQPVDVSQPQSAGPEQPVSSLRSNNSGYRIITDDNGRKILTNVDNDVAVSNEVNSLRDNNVAGVIDGETIFNREGGNLSAVSGVVNLPNKSADGTRDYTDRQVHGQADGRSRLSGGRYVSPSEDSINHTIATLRGVRGIQNAGQVQTGGQAPSSLTQAPAGGDSDRDRMLQSIQLSTDLQRSGGESRSALGAYVQSMNNQKREAKDRDLLRDRNLSGYNSQLATDLERTKAANKTFTLSPGQQAVDAKGNVIASGSVKEDDYPADVMAFFQQERIDDYGNKVKETDRVQLGAFNKYHTAVGGESRQAVAAFNTKVGQLKGISDAETARQWVDQQIQNNPDPKVKTELEALYSAAFPS